MDRERSHLSMVPGWYRTNGPIFRYLGPAPRWRQCRTVATLTPSIRETSRSFNSALSPPCCLSTGTLRCDLKLNDDLDCPGKSVEVRRNVGGTLGESWWNSQRE